jgi:hypothetical protein
MARVKNVDKRLRGLPLSSGRTLGFGEEADGVNVEDEVEAAWIASGSLLVTDGTTEPPAPTAVVTSIDGVAEGWDAEHYFPPKILVRDEGVLYVSKQGSVNKKPADNPEDWLEIDSGVEGGIGIPLAQKGAPNGVATLDGTSKLTGSQLPTSVGTAIASAISTAEAASDAAGAAAAVVAQKGAANGIASLDEAGKLLLAELSSAVIISPSVIYYEGTERKTVPLSLYGIKEGVESTAAWQALVDDLVAKKVAAADIWCGKGGYELNAAPRTDRQGNAILALPIYGGEQIFIHFRGCAGGTTFTTNREGLAYSSEHGVPSVIGGPTPEQLGFGVEGNGSHFSPCTLQMTDIIVITPNNPSIAGIDTSRVRAVILDRVLVKAAGSEAVEPTHKHAFAIRYPEGDNTNRVNIGEVRAEKYYVSHVGNCAHINAKGLFSRNCVSALGITGNEQDAGNDGHASVIQYLNAEHQQYVISSWSPTEGVISIPAGHPAPVLINLLDIEDAKAGWQLPVKHILDANNELYGGANFARVKESEGPVTGPLKVLGGANFRLTEITAAGGGAEASHLGLFGDGSDGEVTLDGVAEVAWATRAGSEYTMTRSCYATRLFINPGITLVPHSYPVFATVKIQNEGIISGNGAAGASTGGAGASRGPGLYAGGTAGGAGTAGAGTAGTNVTGGFAVGEGGGGGKGPSGVGGAGGTVVNPGVVDVLRVAARLLAGSMNFGGTVRNFAGAAGGAGGGGNSAVKGAGGGAGGDIVALYSPTITNLGTITTAGGAGGTPTEANAGGGGGGGGGLICAYTLSEWTAGTTSVAGGAAGAPSGTGEAGKAGGNGHVLNVVLK